jgi:hypothetical protein
MSFYFQHKLRLRSRRLLSIDSDATETRHVDELVRFGIYGVDDALLIAGLAATAAGTGMGAAANAQAQSQMNSVRSAEVKRESDLQNQANSVFQKSLSTAGADTAKKQVASGAAQRQSVYNALKQVAQPTAGAALPSDDAGANPVVTSDGATQTARRTASTRGNAWGNLTSGAAAQEGGYQDQQTDQALENADANRQIGVIGSKARGWAGIMPTEMEVASHSGDALAGWGQLVSALGSVAGVGGAMGYGGASNPWGSANLTTQPNTIVTGQAAGGGQLYGNVGNDL